VIADLLERLRALVFPRRWRRELDEEIRFHLEQDAAARVRAGADPTAARRGALLAFGGVERWREGTLDASGVRLLHDLAADLRFTLRGLRRNPGFTATAVLVLGLAIGSASAVFTVVRTVLLSDLPYPHANRLVRVYQQNSPANRWTLSVVDVQAIGAQQRSFDAFGAARWGVAGIAGAGEPDQVAVGWVTSGGYAHNSNVSIAMGYVPKEHADTQGQWQIELLDERLPAAIQHAPLWDANASRMRG